MKKSKLDLNKLHLGSMSNEEICSAFNIKLSTLIRDKEHYYKILNKYCGFEVVPGGINIIKIVDY